MLKRVTFAVATAALAIAGLGIPAGAATAADGPDGASWERVGSSERGAPTQARYGASWE